VATFVVFWKRVLEMKLKIQLTMMLMTAALFSASAMAWKSYPDQTDDGLDRVKSKKVDALYWKEGASLKGYQKIFLEECSVAFRKNWLRDQNTDRVSVSNRVKPEDMNKIQEELAGIFREQFTRELEKGGYEVVDADGEDVLLLKPAIVDLDVYAPDISMRQAGIMSTYTTSSGEMTLKLDLLDSSTNALIGRIIDKREDHDTGYIQYTNSITNRADAQRIVSSWARILRKALDDAHEGKS
jgi:hypothetical protein